ncbi:MAG: hypothetical protein IKZ20_03705, partial [Bacteroidaceae bacterium]|nr:hypothetical protein [Bacteroidaceae bacterium]
MQNFLQALQKILQALQIFVPPKARFPAKMSDQRPSFHGVDGWGLQPSGFLTGNPSALIQICEFLLPLHDT